MINTACLGDSGGMMAEDPAFNPYEPPVADLNVRRPLDRSFGGETGVLPDRIIPEDDRQLALLNLFGAGIELGVIVLVSSYFVGTGWGFEELSPESRSIGLINTYLANPVIAALHLALWRGFRRGHLWAIWGQASLSAAVLANLARGWFLDASLGLFGDVLFVLGFLTLVAHVLVLKKQLDLWTSGVPRARAHRRKSGFGRGVVATLVLSFLVELGLLQLAGDVSRVLFLFQR